MATLHYAEHVHIVQTRTGIPTPYFCVGQESKSESMSEPISGNVNEPYGNDAFDGQNGILEPFCLLRALSPLTK